MKRVEHTGIRNQNLFCYNCGGEYHLQYPLPVIGDGSFNEKVKAFNKLHADCKPTWKEPEVNQSESIQKRAMCWISNGETGMSSITIWNFFMENKPSPVNIPYDPDDFGRCYKLFRAIPEWRARVKEMGVLSKQWKNLSENWDKLTEMYEENERTNWKNYKKIGMYEFMQTLITQDHL